MSDAGAGHVDAAPLADAAARAAYAHVLTGSPQRSAVATLVFADAVCDAFGYRGRIALASRPGSGAADGAVVLFEKRFGPLVAAARPLLAPTAGPVLRAPLREADVHNHASPLDALAAWAGARYGQATWVLHPSLADARPLAWAGWRLTPTWSYRLDASPDPVAGFRPSARRLAEASADAYAIEPSDAATVAWLAAASLVGKGLAPIDPGRQAAVAHAMIAAGLARAWTARRHDADAPEAGLVALLAPPEAEYWIVGGSGGAGTLLLAAHLAREAAAAGCTHVSFGGANVPSVAAFKRSLGATLTSTLVARWTRGPLAVRDALASLRGSGLRAARRPAR